MRKKETGFSLIEVAIALGIVTFGLVAVLGLLPVGLNLVKENSDEATAVNIMAALSSDLKNAAEDATESPRYHIPLSTANEGRAFFTVEGKWLGKEESYPDAAFAASWEVRSRTDRSPPTALITVTWPAAGSAPPTGWLEALLVLSQNPT